MSSAYIFIANNVTENAFSPNSLPLNQKNRKMNSIIEKSGYEKNTSQPTKNQSRNRSCCIVLLVFLLLPPILVLSSMVFVVVFRSQAVIKEEMAASSHRLPKATNVSFYQNWHGAYIEGDMTWEDVKERFDEEEWKWMEIKPEGFTITCYRFDIIHQSQMEDYNKYSNSNTDHYQHKIKQGYYAFKDEDRIEFIIAYDTLNKRFFFFSHDKY